MKMGVSNRFYLPEWNFKHRDNLASSLPVDDQQEGEAVDAALNQ